MAKRIAQEKEDGKNQAIEQAIQQLKERFGDGAIMRFGEAKQINVEVIPTGCLSIDIALGIGGMPQGRIIEVLALK